MSSTSTAWTPGPWEREDNYELIHKDDLGYTVQVADACPMQRVGYVTVHREQMEANAELIALAPEIAAAIMESDCGSSSREVAGPEGCPCSLCVLTIRLRAIGAGNE